MKGLALCLVLACAGCSVTPAPVWKTDTRAALDAFTETWLQGNSRAADRYFREARASASGTGRPDVVARVELYRCAIGTAGLDFDACAGATAMREDMSAEDAAYAAFLEGRLDASQVPGLPERYRSVAQARDDSARLKALHGIDDPVSRLVAAGALFRASQLAPDGLNLAIDTASEQGWRRPLAAYLTVQLKRAEEAGDTAAAAALKKRIELVAPRE